MIKLKHLLTEQEETSCDKTFDELKTNAPTNTSWTLQKIEGVWTLSSGDFCTKDITIYGAGKFQPYHDEIPGSGQSKVYRRFRIDI